MISFEAFIVPNRPINYQDMPEYLKRSIKKRNELLGIPTPEAGSYVQVWVIGSDYGEDNLTDHGYPRKLAELLGIDADTLGAERFAPGWVSREVIGNFKEGACIDSVTRNGKKLRIRFEQKPYRYGGFGTIEEVLSYLK